MIMTNEQVLKQRCEEANQSHLLHWWNELAENEKEALAKEIHGIDFDLVNHLAQELLAGDAVGASYDTLAPVPVIKLPKTSDDEKKREAARRIGEQEIRAGRTGVICVAGGQGSRLGYEGPKGCLPISPIKGKTIFQLHAEQILALNKRYATNIPWYIMTSCANHQATLDFFEANKYFGLSKKDVIFFTQAMLPAVDLNGKILMSQKHCIAMNPDGHGGTINASAHSGCLADMAKRNIRSVFYFQADNILINILDPVFVGLHVDQQAQMSFKVCCKTCPEEKLGVLGIVDGKSGVVEYSDLKEADMYATNERGELTFWAGSIAIHMFDRDFLEHMADHRLPYHRADKQVPFINEQGDLSKPDLPNGVKFETFIFDALPRTRTWMAMEVQREDEFAPVKNATGVDSLESAQGLYMDRCARWLEACGVNVPRTKDNAVAHLIEINSLYALDERELKQKGCKDLDSTGPVYLS